MAIIEHGDGRVSMTTPSEADLDHAVSEVDAARREVDRLAHGVLKFPRNRVKAAALQASNLSLDSDNLVLHPQFLSEIIRSAGLKQILVDGRLALYQIRLIWALQFEGGRIFYLPNGFAYHMPHETVALMIDGQEYTAAEICRSVPVVVTFETIGQQLAHEIRSHMSRHGICLDPADSK